MEKGGWKKMDLVKELVKEGKELGLEEDVIVEWMEKISELKEKREKFGKKSVNVSECMREMWDVGFSVGMIGKMWGVVYSWVWGVVDRKGDDVKRNSKRKNEENMSGKFRKLWDEGMDIGEISKMLNVNYSWCFMVIKKYRDGGKSNRKLVGDVWVKVK